MSRRAAIILLLFMAAMQFAVIEVVLTFHGRSIVETPPSQVRVITWECERLDRSYCTKWKKTERPLSEEY